MSQVQKVSFNSFCTQVESIAKALEKDYGFENLVIMVTHMEGSKKCVWFTSFDTPEFKDEQKLNQILCKKLEELNLFSSSVQTMFSIKRSFEYSWTICLYSGVKNKEFSFY